MVVRKPVAKPPSDDYDESEEEKKDSDEEYVEEFESEDNVEILKVKYNTMAKHLRILDSTNPPPDVITDGFHVREKVRQLTPITVEEELREVPLFKIPQFVSNEKIL